MNAPIELDRETGLIYRLLPNAEWNRLSPIFKANDWFLPSDILSNAAVAENEHGEIVATSVLQLVLHAEPVWIDSRYSGKVSYLRLWDLLERIPKSKENHLIVPGYVLIAPTEKIAQMAERGKFRPIEGKIYRKLWSE